MLAKYFRYENFQQYYSQHIFSLPFFMAVARYFPLRFIHHSIWPIWWTHTASNRVGCCSTRSSIKWCLYVRCDDGLVAFSIYIRAHIRHSTAHGTAYSTHTTTAAVTRGDWRWWCGLSALPISVCATRVVFFSIGILSFFYFIFRSRGVSCFTLVSV